MADYPILWTVITLVAMSCPARAVGSCVPPAALQKELRTAVTADTYSRIGAWFGEHHRFACAADAYQSALKLKPGSSQLLYFLGLSLFSGGHSEEAVRYLQESIDIEPNVIQPHVILASALELLHRNDQAKREWQAALAIEPHSAIALDGVARGLIKERKFVEVISLLGPVPTEEKLIRDLARALMALNRFQEASTVLKEGLGKEPASASLASMLTQLEIQQHHPQAAESVAQKNAELHPSDLEIQKLYLQAMVYASSLQKARALAPKLLTRSPHDFVLLYLNGVLEHDAGDLHRARKHLEEAVKADATSSAPRYSLGQVLVQLNEPKGAREQLEKALELGGTEPEIHMELGKALRALGEQQAATEQIRLYQHELRERQNHDIATTKMAQGDKALAAGDPQRAAGLYREALEMTPDDAQLHYKVAVALDKIGDISGETAALKKAVQINPELALAHNQLGFLSSQKGDLVAAENRFREATRSAPDFTEAWVNLAAALGLQSRFSEAEEAVGKALALDAKNPQALMLRDTLAKASTQSRR